MIDVGEKSILKNLDGRILIYGAHLVALECMRWLRGMGKEVVGFVVTGMEDNPGSLEDLPVRCIDKYEVSDDTIVVIAMPEKYHHVVETGLITRGYKCIYKMSLEEMSIIKGQSLIHRDEKFLGAGFALKESENDPTWLDLQEKSTHKIICKFPTLFYISQDILEDIIRQKNFETKIDEAFASPLERKILDVNAKRKIADNNINQIMRIYMAFGSNDFEHVEGRLYDEWIYPIQVGSKFTDRIYGYLFDNSGDNISDKNALFAEMTAAYWIWKNAPKTKYKGLCHYRRHFLLDKESIRQIESDDIDAILSIPRYVPGGVKGMFLAETPVKPIVMESMQSAVSEISRQDSDGLDNFLDNEFYCPNNMVIAKNDVYDDYCAWLFPILFRMLEIDIDTGYGHFNDRHIAYTAEVLTSYYFASRSDKLKLCLVDYRLYLDI